MPSARTVSDAHLTDALRATVGTPEGMYGRRKMTAYLRRQGHRVAGCTVDRLMRDEGLFGVIRGRAHRTTIATTGECRRAPDLLDRDFTAAAPNRKWVTDFTYTRTWMGSSMWRSSSTASHGRSWAGMPPPLRNRDGDDGPLNTLGDVELITADYVSWYNQQRLMHRLDRVPPAEAEAQYYSQHVTDHPAGSQNPEGA